MRDLPLLTLWRMPKSLCTDQGKQFRGSGRKHREQKGVKVGVQVSNVLPSFTSGLG